MQKELICYFIGSLLLSDKLKFDDLKLLPGTKLDVRSEQYAMLKGSSTYIGALNKKSLIISTPLSNGRPISCSSGNPVVVRLYVNHLSCACAFRAEITHVAVRPYPHLFLEFPEQIETGALRKSPRINVHLIGYAKTSLITKPQPVAINNISTDGARLQSKLFLGEQGDKVKITTKVTVLGVDHIISMIGVIRACSDPLHKDYYGIQFINLDDEVRLILYAYVMSEITR